MSEPVLTVANQLTILRMMLAPALVVFVLSGELVWALAAFALAAVTDLLDGLIARLGRQRTNLGAMLDPVADKILLTAAFVSLTWGDHLTTRIPVWLTVTTLSRDAILLISVAVINLTIGRRVYPPSLLGKASTAIQIVTAGVVLTLNALGHVTPAVHYLFVLALVATVASALHYTWRASLDKPAVSP